MYKLRYYSVSLRILHVHICQWCYIHKICFCHPDINSENKVESEYLRFQKVNFQWPKVLFTFVQKPKTYEKKKKTSIYRNTCVHVYRTSMWPLFFLSLPQQHCLPQCCVRAQKEAILQQLNSLSDISLDICQCFFSFPLLLPFLYDIVYTSITTDRRSQ